jgi:hypothetical protein
VKSFNFYVRKHHPRNHFRRSVRLPDFCHGAAGKILTHLTMKKIEAIVKPFNFVSSVEQAVRVCTEEKNESAV